MCCTWFEHDCTRATWAYCVGDGSRHSEEIVKKLELCLCMRLLLLLLLSLLLLILWFSSSQCAYACHSSSLVAQWYTSGSRATDTGVKPCFPWSSHISDQQNYTLVVDCLAGLVVKASASGAEDPGFESRLRQNFFGLSRTSDLKIGTPVATLPGAWHYRVSAGTGQPSVSILWLGEVESLICNFYLSVAARKIVCADLSLRYTSMLLGR